MRLEADRAHARSAAAVRNGEGLVQVHVAHISANVTRTHQPHQRIHVGAVHVDLTTVGVNDVDDLADRLLEHPVRGRIGNHQAAKLLAMLFGLGLQVGHIHVAIVVAGHRHHLHAHHLGRSGVGAVCRSRNQADVPPALATAFVVAADGQQAGIFTRRSGVRLHRDGVKAGNGLELVHQPVDQFGIARHLRLRRKRVHIAESLPAHRNHLAGGIEFHGAAAQRNHGVIQRQIAVLQLFQVTHHLGFAVMRIEHRMRQDGGFTLESGRELLAGSSIQRSNVGRLAGQQLDQGSDISPGGDFVECHGQRGVIHAAQVVTGGFGGSQQGIRPGAGVDQHGIKEGFAGNRAAVGTHAVGKQAGQTVDAGSDALDAFRPVIGGIHAGHVGQQHLRGADVRVGLFAADVLLAGL